MHSTDKAEEDWYQAANKQQNTPQSTELHCRGTSTPFSDARLHTFTFNKYRQYRQTASLTDSHTRGLAPEAVRKNKYA